MPAGNPLICLFSLRQTARALLTKHDAKLCKHTLPTESARQNCMCHVHEMWGGTVHDFGGDRGPRFVKVDLRASGGPRFITQDFVDHDLLTNVLQKLSETHCLLPGLVVAKCCNYIRLFPRLADEQRRNPIKSFSGVLWMKNVVIP